MIFNIFHNGKNIGKVDLLSDNFSLKDVTDQAHAENLESFLRKSYEEGISVWAENDELQTKPLMPSDHRFPLYLGEKLLAIGYILK
jgi:hypothetical protein